MIGPAPARCWSRPIRTARSRIQREIGLSGHACARLPACVANAQEPAFQIFERIMDELQKYQIEHPEYRLPKFDRCLKGRQSSQDLPNP